MTDATWIDAAALDELNDRARHVQASRRPQGITGALFAGRIAGALADQFALHLLDQERPHQ